MHKIVNELRYVAAETISNAKSGHTGVALGAADIFYALFANHLVIDPSQPKWENRDRFVLSAGHASALLYACMNLFGLGISTEDLKQFRKVNSLTPGHPEIETPFIEASTGPLGQGIAMAVGMAIAEEWSHATKQVPPSYTYAFHGDGCLMEGVALEAISLAGNLQLERLVLLYDYNQITIDGTLNLSNRENVKQKFVSQGWRVIECKKGNDASAVSKALAKAKKPCGKPTIVVFHTIIGYGCEHQGQSKIHGVPLSKEELTDLKNKLQVNNGNFDFSPEVLSLVRANFEKRLQKDIAQRTGNANQTITNKSDLKKALRIENKDMSGRDAGAQVLNLAASVFPSLIGGTADLVPSVRAYITNGGDFNAKCRTGRNIRYGVREHGMAAIANGISLFGHNKTFVSTFFSFCNYMMPAIRLSAFMKQPVVYIFTHDSVFAGEDGPTHQPVEQLGALRLMPQLHVVRPCDALETQYAYSLALTSEMPTCIVLAKQTLKAQNSSLSGAEKGGYLLKEVLHPQVTILATGSEVQLAMQVAEILEQKKVAVNVASMPCLDVFKNQTASYQQRVLGNGPRFVIEASNDASWFEFIAGNGLFFNINNFGKSGKGEDVYALFYEAEFMAKTILAFCKKKNKNVE